MRVYASRPLLIAIGPTSAAAVRNGHTDLELADVILVESEDISRLPALRESGMFDRSLVVCLFDRKDESLWQTAAAVMTLVSEVAAFTPWLVCAAPSQQLARLASHLGVTAIDPGDIDALSVALIPIVCCARSGLIGFDAVELAVIARPGRVGRALRIPLRCDVRATDALITLRCGRNSELSELNDMCTTIAAALTSSTLLIAAPMLDTDKPLQVDIIAW